jgi:hypothetical protein
MISILLRKVATCQVQLQSGFLDAIHKAREIAYRIGLRISYWTEPCTINYCKYTLFYIYIYTCVYIYIYMYIYMGRVISYWMDCKVLYLYTAYTPRLLLFWGSGKGATCTDNHHARPRPTCRWGRSTRSSNAACRNAAAGSRTDCVVFAAVFLVLLPVRPMFFGALDIINTHVDMDIMGTSRYWYSLCPVKRSTQCFVALSLFHIL